MTEVLTGVGAHSLAPPAPRKRVSEHRRGPDEIHRYDRLEYRIYTVLLFPFAVLAVLAKRMAGHRSADGHHFLGEVIELNRTTVPWIFMGR